MRSHGFHADGERHADDVLHRRRRPGRDAPSACRSTTTAWPSGTGYRAPSGAIHLPPALARRVISVDGLSTLPLMHPLGLHRVHHKAGVRTSRRSRLTACSRRTTSDSTALQPAAGRARRCERVQLAAAPERRTTTARGESVALVGVLRATRTPTSARYQTCYGTTVPVHQGERRTAARPSTAGGRSRSRSTRRCWRVRHRASTTSRPSWRRSRRRWPAVLDAIYTQHAAEGVHIVSDSWGNCEVALLEADQAATNRELQLMAVAGHVVLRRVGRRRARRTAIAARASTASQVDDPAVQPYATGVGGTNLNPGRRTETVWGGHGPSAAAGAAASRSRSPSRRGRSAPGVIRIGQSSKTKCGGKTRWCREVPDVAFDADPTTGYVIIRAVTTSGGTSSAARRRRHRSWPPSRPTRTGSASRTAERGWASQTRSCTTSSRSIRRCSTTSPSGSNNILGGTTYPPAPATTWRAALARST